MIGKRKGKYWLLAVIVLLLVGLLLRQPKHTRILVFYRTMGWKHSSIPQGIAAIGKIAAANGFVMDTSSNPAIFTDKVLRKYSAIIFNNTTGNILTGEQQAAFERYIQAGGGFVGIHAAADTEYDWPWYGKLVGAYFESHPRNPGIQNGRIVIQDTTHPATRNLPGIWERTDEWYSYKAMYSDLTVLATLDEDSYTGGTNGAAHPISWYHEFDGGRSFYTGLGHTESTYDEPLFVQHLSGGIAYAIGKAAPLDYSRAYAVVTPDQNRFVKKILVADLNAPMELAAASDGRIYFTELFGNLSVFDPKTGSRSILKKIPVTTTGGTGLIGITLDPNFSSNHHLYLYYAPGGQTKEPLYFNLSRFTLTQTGAFDSSSEKILLRVPVQENSGSHHGGSLAWDKEQNLYLSTGDGSSPFPSNGFAPLDERPGAEHYSLDAQRGSSNTNDFKGKILRIHPEPDGSYSIPKGNLFAPGTPKTKAEIYVMGTRNPYRIAVNPKTSVLYWGEIGPDAGTDTKRGPRGYDEFNQARRAGNYGWPYFVGNNFAYSKWDFAADTAGPLFNPLKPENHSPNNTGLTELPPAVPAMIWYPYAASAEFPELGIGGRSAMAGAFYQYDPDNTASNKFPEYYDGTLFVFDWMRNWVISLRFDKNENYVRNEAFMAAHGDFRRPIDACFGKDGTLYMLEYGSVYGAANKDARLVRIEYFTGNRPPIARASIVDTAYMAWLDKTAMTTTEYKQVPEIRSLSGQAPLQVQFSSRASKDLDDGDQLSYEWYFNGKELGATKPNPDYTYTVPGVYAAILKVTDAAGLVSRDTLQVVVGNTQPELRITGSANLSFASDDELFRYQVQVKDKEDGNIDKSRIRTFYVYNPEPVSLPAQTEALLNLQSGLNSTGRQLFNSGDCSSCHIAAQKAVGPSLLEIAQRYKNKPGALAQLAAKVIAGGAGNWGTVSVMNAHPQLSPDDAQEIIRYIFSLTDKVKSQNLIPASGSLKLKFTDAEPRGEYTLVAAYSDSGGNIQYPLTGTAVAQWRNRKMKAAHVDAYAGFDRFRDDLTAGGHKSYLLFRNIDLSQLRQLVVNYSSGNEEGTIELRLDSRAGKLAGQAAYAATHSWDKAQPLKIGFDSAFTGRHDLYIIAVWKTPTKSDIIKFHSLEFN